MAEHDMSDDNSTPPIGEPIDAASPDANASEQVAGIAGMETKKPLLWVEEGEVKRLWDALSSLKEELKAELSSSCSATEDKLHVCVKELEEKIKVILVRTENEQESEASNIVNAVLTQHEMQEKQMKEKLNSLEETKNELKDTKEELNKMKQKVESKKSKLKELKSNHKISTSEKDEAIAKRDQEIITLSDILKMKGEEIETKDDKIKELEEKFEIAMAELKEAKAELKEAKEDAKKNAEEVKEFPGALKTKEDQIQSLERQLSKSENDRKYWKGKCEGLDKCVAAVDSTASAMHEAMHKIPDAVKNRQRSHKLPSVVESVSPSSNITDADQGHFSNESDISD